MATQLLSVLATAANSAYSDLSGGGLSAIEVNSTTSQAIVLGSTSIVIDEGVTLDVGSLTSRAEAANTSNSRSAVGGIAGVTVDLMDLKAITNHDLVARLGPAAAREVDGALNGNLGVGQGGITLEALSSNMARVHQVDVTVAAVGVEVVRPFSSARGTTRAYLGCSFTTNADLTAHAEADNRATSEAVNVEIEASDTSVIRDSVTTAHTTESFVTPSADLQVGGKLQLWAFADNNALVDQVNALDIAAVDVAVVSSRAVTGGATNALIDRGSEIVADQIILSGDAKNSAEMTGFNLGVSAIAIGVARPTVLTAHNMSTYFGVVPDVRRSFDPQEVVAVDANTLVFDHLSLVIGDRVQYFSGTVGGVAASPIKGLSDGEAYYVSVDKIDDTTQNRLHNSRENALQRRE